MSIALADVRTHCGGFVRIWGREAFMSQPPPVRSALCDAAFQLGPVGLAAFHHALGALESGDCRAAMEGFVDSRWDRETPHRVQNLVSTIRDEGCRR